MTQSKFDDDTIQHFQVLGLTSDATFDQVEAEYLDRCRQLQSVQGASQPIKKVAESLIARFTHAYQALKEVLGPGSTGPDSSSEAQTREPDARVDQEPSADCQESTASPDPGPDTSGDAGTTEQSASELPDSDESEFFAQDKDPEMVHWHCGTDDYLPPQGDAAGMQQKADEQVPEEEAVVMQQRGNDLALTGEVLVLQQRGEDPTGPWKALCVLIAVILLMALNDMRKMWNTLDGLNQVLQQVDN